MIDRWHKRWENKAKTVLTVSVRQTPARTEVCREAPWCRLSALSTLQDGRSHAALPPVESPGRAVTHAELPHSPGKWGPEADRMFGKFLNALSRGEVRGWGGEEFVKVIRSYLMKRARDSASAIPVSIDKTLKPLRLRAGCAEVIFFNDHGRFNVRTMQTFPVVKPPECGNTWSTP